MDEKEKVKGLTERQADILRKSKVWEKWDDKTVLRMVAGQMQEFIPSGRVQRAFERDLGIKFNTKDKKATVRDNAQLWFDGEVGALEKYGIADEDYFKSNIPDILLKGIDYPKARNPDFINAAEIYRESEKGIMELFSESESESIGALFDLLQIGLAVKAAISLGDE